MKNIHSGSCLCEQVKFEIEGDFDGMYLCHCEYCQKDTGSAFASNLFSTTAQLRWLCGEEKVKTFNLKPTRHKRGFCQDCGSGLPSIHMEGKLLVVPAGSLDTELEITPTAHIFCSSKASWEHDLETLKKFETFPS